MKLTKKILSVLLAAAILFTASACEEPGTPDPSGSTGEKESKNETAIRSSDHEAEDPDLTDSEAAPEAAPYTVVSLKDAKAGDVVVFGSYEQNANASDGKEPLEWLVLAKDGGSLLVITLYAVEHMQFHSSLSAVTWETSAVRTFLNGEFLNKAFAEEEKAKIRQTTVVAEKNPDYPNSRPGSDTEDKVFLLNVQEMALYFKDKSDAICAPTATVVASSNVFSHTKKAWYSGHDYLCSWWLRSPGMFKDLYVSYVDHSGNVSGGGQVYVEGTDLCVRPAMWITGE